jgi:uncharacterized protein YjgD (DUF1641 family)
VSYARYCFFNCEPPKKEAKLGDDCQAISREDQNLQETTGGNGEDLAEVKPTTGEPATILDPDPDKAAKAALEPVKEQPKEETKEEEEEEKENMQIVADAQGKEAQASAIEARTADAEVKTKRNRMLAATAATAAINADNSDFTSVAQLDGEETQSQIWTHIAAKSAGIAAQELAAIRATAAEAAGAAAKAATAEMQKIADEASKKAAALKAKFNPPKPKTAQAANLVVKPYNAAQARAMGIRNMYSEKAQELSNGAKDLQKNAGILAAQAAAYQAGGHAPGMKLAPGMMARAKDMLNQAAAMDAEAQNFQGVAASITKTIPDYQLSANMAAARATALANPAGQPPIPLPMLTQLRSSKHKRHAAPSGRAEGAAEGAGR